MPTPLHDIAGFPLVLVCALAALAAVVVTGVQAWRRLRALLRALDGADTLVNVHTQALERHVLAVGASGEQVGADSQRVSRAVASLQVSIRELRYLAGLVPRERERLRQLLLELVLPTGDGWRRWRNGAR